MPSYHVFLEVQTHPKIDKGARCVSRDRTDSSVTLESNMADMKPSL